MTSSFNADDVEECHQKDSKDSDATLASVTGMIQLTHRTTCQMGTTAQNFNLTIAVCIS
jgi:hypothetical protein